MANIKYPFGDADLIELTASGAQAIEIEDNLTVIDGASVAGTADRTLNLTLSDELQIGARLFIINLATAGNLVFGTNITGTSVAFASPAISTRSATYDGESFMVDNEN